MSIDNIEDTLKIIVVGNGNVGKTTMLRRYVKGSYSEQYKKTIGADYLEKELYLKELKQNVTMMLWDTAGQEVFNALTSSYYRGAAACVLAYSTIDRDSFQNVVEWKKKVEAQCGTDIVMVLCQTKFDLAKEEAMSTQEADKMAGHLGLPFFRISTKEDFNVSALFEFVARQCILKGSGGDGGMTTLQSSTGDKDKSAPKDKKEKKPTDEVAEEKASPKDEKKDKDKKDKKDKKEKDTGKDEGGNTKPIQMKELKKKEKKDKKKGVCVV